MGENNLNFKENSRTLNLWMQVKYYKFREEHAAATCKIKAKMIGLLMGRTSSKLTRSARKKNSWAYYNSLTVESGFKCELNLSFYRLNSIKARSTIIYIIYSLMRLYMCVCTHTHTHIYIYSYMYIHIHRDIYIYMYTHIHTHIL